MIKRNLAATAVLGLVLLVPTLGANAHPIGAPALRKTIAPTPTTTPTTTPTPTPIETPVEAGPTTTVLAPPAGLLVTGRGYGHGRGLGQWGAYGYAVDKGWTYRQILDHFYGGTSAGFVAPQSAIGVHITSLDNAPLVVFQPKGRLYTAVDGQPFAPPPSLVAPSLTVSTSVSVQAASTIAPPKSTTTVPTTAPGLPINGTGAAVKVQLTKAGFIISDAPKCSGPWTARPPVVSRTLTISAGPADPTANADEPTEMLQVCVGKNTRKVYRGDLLTTDGQPGQRVINLVALDAYLRSVVPHEVSPSWADNGMESVKAQAVAARSYAASEKRTGFANTCDTTSCQVYTGRGSYVGEVFTSLEDPRTDRSIAETALEIRVQPKTGIPVRTEFSASTGGTTAGGDFPSVVDEGDRTARNPNQAWSVRLSSKQLGADAKLGAFVSGEVATRDGVGPDGGRATQIKLTFTKGTQTVSALDFVRRFGMKSTWFNVEVLRGGSIADAVPTTVATVIEVADPVTTTVVSRGTKEKGTKGKGKKKAQAETDAVIAVKDTAPSTAKPKAAKAAKPAKPQKPPKPIRANPTATTALIAVRVGADPVKEVNDQVVGVPTTIKSARKRTAGPKVPPEKRPAPKSKKVEKKVVTAKR
jgi:SpoIID/LytB domain protein